MVLSERPLSFHGMNRNLAIASSVLIVHVAVLWAMQTGLLRRAAEWVVPAEILVEFIEPPAPIMEAPPAPPRPAPVKPALAKPPTPAPAPAPVRTDTPQPLAIADPAPSPQAPVGVMTPVVASPPVAAPVAMAPPAPARVEQPSSDADYLQNPRPSYPALSKRLGEQGKVVVRIFIDVEGKAQQADIKQSSGFDRLDQAALATAQRWRYVPGKRGGVSEAMWSSVPINFVLE